MMVFSLLETLFIVHVHFHSCQFSVPPHWLKVLMLRYVAPVIRLPQRRQSNRTTVSLPERGEGKQTQSDHSWRKYVDKIMLVTALLWAEFIVIHHSPQKVANQELTRPLVGFKTH